MKQAWLLEIEYLNASNKLVVKSEYHTNATIAYQRLNALTAKLRVLKASVKQEVCRGESK